VPVLLYKLYGARTILNTIIQSLTPHNSMLNMSLVKHSVTRLPHLKSLFYKLTFKLATFHTVISIFNHKYSAHHMHIYGTACIVTYI